MMVTTFSIKQDIRIKTPDKIEEIGAQNYYLKLFGPVGEKVFQYHDYNRKAIKGKKLGFMVITNDTDYCGESIFCLPPNLAFKSARIPESDKRSMTFRLIFREENTNKITHRSFPLKQSQNDFWSEEMGYYSIINNIYFKVLRDNLEKFFETGITHKLIKDIVDRTFMEDFLAYYEPYDDKKEVVPLSYSMMEAFFVIWLVAVLIATIVFIFEIIHHKLMKQKDKLMRMKRTKKRKIKINIKKRPIKRVKTKEIKKKSIKMTRIIDEIKIRFGISLK